MENKEQVEEIVFNSYAKTYKEGLKKNVKISGFSPDYFHSYKVEELFGYLKKKQKEKDSLKILDFGCGVGCSDSYLSKYFPNSKIYACDISDESVKCAKEENSQFENLKYAVYDNEKIPFDEKFDIIFVANVFHHIPRKLHLKTMNMLKESLSKDGFLIIFEHNPYNPATVLLSLLTDYRYDKNTNLLTPVYMKKSLYKAGFTQFDLTYKIFFPGILKSLVPYEKYLKFVPLGAHYYYIAR